MTQRLTELAATGLLVVTMSLGSLVSAQTGASTKVKAYRASHESQILREFIDLLSLPNLAGDSVNIRKNADFIAAMLSRRGVHTRLLEVAGGPPIVYGAVEVAGAKHTVALYAHYDGQPVDEAQWASPPWAPVLRDKRLEDGGKQVALSSLPGSLPGEWRIYGRSAGDDKAPIQAMMSVLDGLRETGTQPAVNLKFFFEGEEEAGSPHLPDAIRQYADLLTADLWILCDGPVHQTRTMQVFFGSRGEIGLEMTVYGPTRGLHDGHYGNWAPNPAFLAADLVSSMRDRDGRIKIKGFYDDVRAVSDTERKAIAEMPEVDSGLKSELGLATTEGQPEKLPMRIMAPALNLRGIETGHVGDKAANAIPTEAKVSIDFRLVPDEHLEKVRDLVEEHIRGEGFYIVRAAPTAEERRTHPRIIQVQWGPGNPAARTSMDLPASRAVVKTIEDSTGASIVKAPTLGGTLPMYLFTDVLKAPVIGVPIANHDDNQHSSNENLRLENLWNAIDIFGGLFTDVERNWK